LKIKNRKNERVVYEVLLTIKALWRVRAELFKFAVASPQLAN